MALVPSNRYAVAFPSIRRAPTARFLTGATAGLSAMMVVGLGTATSSVPMLLRVLGGIAPMVGLWTAGLGLGYFVTKQLMQSRLREDADLGGRRSFVAGLCAAGAMVASTLYLRVTMSPGTHVGIGLLIGTTITAAMFAPWLVSSDLRRSLRELESPPDQDG